MRTRGAGACQRLLSTRINSLAHAQQIPSAPGGQLTVKDKEGGEGGEVKILPLPSTLSPNQTWPVEETIVSL